MHPGRGGFFFVQRIVLGPGTYDLDFECHLPPGQTRLILEGVALERPSLRISGPDAGPGVGRQGLSCRLPVRHPL